MADDARQTHPDLSADDDAPLPDDVGFFELLRGLERDGRRFGRGGGPEREPARLGQGARLTFPTRDIARVEQPASPDVPPFVSVQVLGLLGPEGPMPLHLTRWVLMRLSNRWFAGEREGATSDTAFLDFCNMLQHRMVALYWRAWADARPEVQIAYRTGSRATAPIAALAGIGLPGTATGGPERKAAKMRHATALAGEVHGPERLTRYLSDVIGAPVELVEFVGVWTEIPPALQSRLGGRWAALGGSAVLGRRAFERQSRALLRVGPLGLVEFERLLDHPEAMAELRHALLFAAGHEMDFDLRLVLKREAVPEPRLGSGRLGRTIWLGNGPRRDADDLRLPLISRRPRPELEAAA